MENKKTVLDVACDEIFGILDNYGDCCICPLSNKCKNDLNYKQCINNLKQYIKQQANNKKEND